MIKAFAYVKFHQDIPSDIVYAETVIADMLEDKKNRISYDYSSLQVSKTKTYKERTYVDVEGLFIITLEPKDNFQIDDYVGLAAPTFKQILRSDTLVSIHVHNIINTHALPFARL